mgnify:CR=1 FL=1
MAMQSTNTEIGYHKILKVVEEELSNTEAFEVMVLPTENPIHIWDTLKHVDVIVSQHSPKSGKVWKRAYRFSSIELIILAEDYHAHSKIEVILEDLVSTVALCLFYGKQMY